MPKFIRFITKLLGKASEVSLERFSKELSILTYISLRSYNDASTQSQAPTLLRLK
jgi:hypothetical protein